MYCADLTFGLSPQSLAILHLLARRETEFAEFSSGHYKVHIETTPWYNGLEKGVALQVYRGWKKGGPCKVIVFGECREDDQIFIEHWDQPDSPFNAPSVEQRDAYLWPLSEGDPEQERELPREVFERNETYGAAERIYQLMEEFYVTDEEKEAPPNNLVRMPARLRRV